MLKKFLKSGGDIADLPTSGLAEYLRRVQIPAYVYIGTDASGLYKIGRTTGSPEAREQQIRRMNPSFKMLAYVQAGDKGVRLERHLHIKYNNSRVVGEWFRLTREEAAEALKEVTP